MASSKKILVAFGGLDLVHFSWIVLASIMASKIPFYTDLKASYDIAFSYGNNTPIYAAWATAILYASIISSGILLMLGRRSGVIISCIQFPFRVLLVVPSIFFFSWFLNASSSPGYIWTVYAFIVITEVFKLFMLLRR
jgi:hypothetical protein